MPIPLAQGNFEMMKQAHTNNIALGERAVSSDFVFTIQGLEHLTPLCRTTSIPENGREPIEDYGQYGQLFQQQAAPKKAGEFGISFVTDVAGELFKAMRDAYRNKTYFNATLALRSEDDPNSKRSMTFYFENCWIKSDAFSLSTEDRTSLVKPDGTFYYNWYD